MAGLFVYFWDGQVWMHAGSTTYLAQLSHRTCNVDHPIKTTPHGPGTRKDELEVHPNISSYQKNTRHSQVCCNQSFENREQ
jgi:hypothetical protein